MDGCRGDETDVRRASDGKLIYFDGVDNSDYILGKTQQSARTSWVYIDRVPGALALISGATA
jgi:hypothetical protein